MCWLRGIVTMFWNSTLPLASRAPLETLRHEKACGRSSGAKSVAGSGVRMSGSTPRSSSMDVDGG
jgi:hypothetical protein